MGKILSGDEIAENYERFYIVHGRFSTEKGDHPAWRFQRKEGGVWSVTLEIWGGNKNGYETVIRASAHATLEDLYLAWEKTL